MRRPLERLPWASDPFEIEMPGDWLRRIKIPECGVIVSR